MTPETFKLVALDPALALLPAVMDSVAARAMIVAICLQESKLTHRRQVGGPARSFAQFELGGGIRGVLNHPASREHIRRVLTALSYDQVPDTSYAAIEHNDVLCAAYSRLLLWTDPHPLPARGEHEEAWQIYLSCWRPGKPHRATWDAFYDQGWQSTIGVTP